MWKKPKLLQKKWLLESRVGGIFAFLVLILLPGVKSFAKDDEVEQCVDNMKEVREECLISAYTFDATVVKKPPYMGGTETCQHYDKNGNTLSHVAKSYYHKKVFSNSRDYCYQYMEVTQYTCSNCGASWENQKVQYTAPHECSRLACYYDDTYAWIYMVCHNYGCSYRAFVEKEPHHGMVPVPIGSRKPVLQTKDAE